MATLGESSWPRAGVGALETGRTGGRDEADDARAFSEVGAAEDPEWAVSPKNSLRPEAAATGVRGMREFVLRFTIK